MGGVIRLGEGKTHYIICFKEGNQAVVCDDLNYLHAEYNFIYRQFQCERIQNFSSNKKPDEIPPLRVLFYRRGHWKEDVSVTIGSCEGKKDLVELIKDELRKKEFELVT